MIAVLILAALSAPIAQAAPVEQACDFTEVLAAADYTRLVQERNEFAAPVLEAVDLYIFSISQAESMMMELDVYELVEKSIRAKADEVATSFNDLTVQVQKNGVVFTRRAVTPESPQGHEFSVRVPFTGYQGMLRAREHGASKGVLAGLGTRKEFLAQARQHDESCELASARQQRHQAPRETEGFDKLIQSLAPIYLDARPEALAQITSAGAR